MKKFLFLVLAFLLVGAGVLIAQDVVVPTDWQDLYDNYGVFFATYLGIAGVATFLGEPVIRLLKLTVKWQKVAVVSVIAIAVSFFGQFANVGYLADSIWWQTLIWGATAAAAAAGVRSANLLFIKSVVDFIIDLIIKKEPTG